MRDSVSTAGGDVHAGDVLPDLAAMADQVSRDEVVRGLGVRVVADHQYAALSGLDHGVVEDGIVVGMRLQADRISSDALEGAVLDDAVSCPAHPDRAIVG